MSSSPAPSDRDTHVAARSDLWVFWLKGNRSFNVHRSRDCHRLSVTLGPFCLRWDW